MPEPIDGDVNLPGEFIVKQWAEDLPAEFEVGQDSRDLFGEFIIRHEMSVDLPAIFDGQTVFNLPAEFFVNQAAVDLLGEFMVKQWQEDLPAEFSVLNTGTIDLSAEFIVLQWLENIPTRLRTMRIYDLRGTTGIGFHWQGAANPPSSIVDFIIESPTGFWVGEFSDGPAEFRDVFFPWHELRETGLDGTKPNMGHIDGFTWIVHTDGLRRIDYIYARPFGDLHGIFTVQQRVIPPANSYFNLVGDIWLQEIGGYHKRESGTGALYVDDPEGWGGWYWNRV